MAKKTSTHKGTITKISGPVVYAAVKGRVNDLVRVGDTGLMGEIIELRGTTCVIQVYEDTTGLKPGESVINTQQPLSVVLGPGLLGSVFDGTERPLATIMSEKGIFIPRGVNVAQLNMKKKWEFKPTVKNGDNVDEGQSIGTVKENTLITHHILVPPGVSGTVKNIKAGKYTLQDTIASVGTTAVTMMQQWPVRKARPFQKRVPVSQPLVSGQRILDFLFPLAKGGVAAIPGPFGAGKTVTQQQFAKWCDADIIVYIGCGERGNEMTEILEEFPHLKDPKSGKPLMDRTILIANTSNMPVAAREASVYTGITIAEYFRDQGYAVALMADSTSRWAEAMREISGRLEEMPGEEGYPAYLAKRLAEFYERAGVAKTLSGKTGSISVVGAVSPPGGDFSEPVTQNTLRIVRCFWALDAKLADKRHFPSINWLQSYSLYHDTVGKWYDSNISEDWSRLRIRAEDMLQTESELQEIVQLVGLDSLPKEQQLLLFAAKMIREDFLQQNAFHEEDTFCPLQKQMTLIHLIFAFYEYAKKHLNTVQLEELRGSDAATYIAQLKYQKNDAFTEKSRADMEAELKRLMKKAMRK